MQCTVHNSTWIRNKSKNIISIWFYFDIKSYRIFFCTFVATATIVIKNQIFYGILSDNFDPSIILLVYCFVWQDVENFVFTSIRMVDRSTWNCSCTEVESRIFFLFFNMMKQGLNVFISQKMKKLRTVICFTFNYFLKKILRWLEENLKSENI